jgi:hypothetical protein
MVLGNGTLQENAWSRSFEGKSEASERTEETLKKQQGRTRGFPPCPNASTPIMGVAVVSFSPVPGYGSKEESENSGTETTWKPPPRSESRS